MSHWEAKPERENSSVEDHGKIGICLRGHLKLKLLLLGHSGEASRTPHCVHGSNCSGRTTSC